MKSVTVCSSKRYADEVAKFCKELELLGVMVFEPDFGEPMPEDGMIHSEYITGKIFKGLTLEHFDWVRKADVCFVFNKGDYAGISVGMEMAFACALGKPIIALSPKTGDPCRDALIDKVVSSPKKLVVML